MRYLIQVVTLAALFGRLETGSSAFWVWMESRFVCYVMQMRGSERYAGLSHVKKQFDKRVTRDWLWNSAEF